MKIATLESLHADAGTVPWHDDLVIVKPAVKDGYITLPTGLSWDTELDEATVRAYPPRQR